MPKALYKKSDEGFLKEVVAKVIAAHPAVAEEYKAGKDAALQFLVGQGMKESKGAANPAVLREQFKEVLTK